MTRRRLAEEGGASLLLAMGAITLLGVFATSTLAFAGVGSRQGAVSGARTEQLYAADAGMEHGIRGLAADTGLCNRGGATHTWPPMQFNGRTVTYRCEWVSGTGAPGSPRTARVISTATGPGNIEVTTAAAIVRPDGTPTVLGWELHGEWESPGPSTTTTTQPPPPTTSTTSPPSSTTSTTLPGPPRFPGTLWLKTSRPGHVWSSPDLPLAPVAPTAHDLPNYDIDRDWMPGLLVRRGPGKADEKKDERHQDWLVRVDKDTRLVGEVELELFSSMPYFLPGLRGAIEVFLADCNGTGTSCTTIASAYQERASWNGGAWQWDWVPTTFAFGRLDRTFAAGRTLKLVVTVDNRARDDMWIAYDTVDQPSRLVIR